MAKRAHYKILEQGVDVWNRWRVENPRVKPDLESANLFDTNLQGANLSEAKLQGQTLIWANMRDADLGGADLTGADLRGADLSGADLTFTDLRSANLQETRLEGSNFSSAIMGFTLFAENDLSTVEGLETVRHFMPSTIGLDTIYKSKGKISEAFLRGCGVPEDFILYMRSLAGKAVDYYSCFISYSSKDDDFARRFHADLRAKNVRCWKFDENARWGESVWGEIDTAIRHCDKLVVICSENSLESAPVIREIERALQKEDREHKNVLFPIRVDDYLLDTWEHPRKADVVSKVIGDFREWRDNAAYSNALPRFLDALNRPPQATAR
jgi:hypothetical protein